MRSRIRTLLGHCKSSLPLSPPPFNMQVFLSLAFLHEALLMGLHGKHAPLDARVHVLLTAAMLSCAVCTAAEAAWRHCSLLTAGRVASTALQVGWDCRLLFTHFPHLVEGVTALCYQP